MSVQFVNIRTGAEFSTATGRFTPGIYDVVPEEVVVRAYMNGVSFKHFPAPERRSYQVAVAQRIRELGHDVALKCQQYAPAVIDLFARWYELEAHAQLLEANALTELMPPMLELAAALKMKTTGLAPDKLLANLRHAFTRRNPKHVAAGFAAHCRDRSNLGQASFLRLVAAGRGFLDAQGKVELLQTHFEAERDEFLSFLLFRRATWTELLLARRYRTVYSWARNFVVGTANKFQAALQSAGVRLPELGALTAPKVLQAVGEVAGEVQESLTEKQEAGGDVSRIQRLLNSLRLIEANPDVITTFFEPDPTDSPLTWKRLKAYANTIRGISFSAIRKVIVRACSHRPEWQHAIERCLRLFTPETTLKRPFHERVGLHPLPIDLVMGSKYVIYRPGNAAQLQALLLREGRIWFEIPQVPLATGRQTVKVVWVAQKSVLRALKNGAKVKSFRFSMPQGPGKTIKVTIMLEGPESAFLGMAYLESPPITAPPPNILAEGRITPKPVLGLDINRPSEWLLTAGGDLGFDQVLEQTLARWRHAEQTIATLQQKLERTRDWRRRLKLKEEIQLHHQRRTHLKQQLFHEARTHLGRVIQALGVTFVSVEGNLTRVTRDKRGALAKAIAGMPDHLELVARAILAVNQLYQRAVKCVLVRKEGTSQVHHACGGRINRVGDLGTCRTCGQEINVHQNAAANVEAAAEKLIAQHLHLIIETFLSLIIPGGAPSTCTGPGTQPPDIPKRVKV